MLSVISVLYLVPVAAALWIHVYVVIIVVVEDPSPRRCTPHITAAYIDVTAVADAVV